MKKEERAKIERRLRRTTVIAVYGEELETLHPGDKLVRKLRHRDTTAKPRITWWAALNEDWWRRLSIRADTELFFFGGEARRFYDVPKVHTLAEWADLLPEGWAGEALAKTSMPDWSAQCLQLSTAIKKILEQSSISIYDERWCRLYEAVVRNEELPKYKGEQG